jgi:hypothetical protein
VTPWLALSFYACFLIGTKSTVCRIAAKKEEQTSTTIRAILAVIDTKSHLDGAVN